MGFTTSHFLSAIDASGATEYSDTHQFAVGVQPGYRRYLADVAPDTLLPFVQGQLLTGYTRATGYYGNSGPNTSWTLGAAFAAGGEYLFGPHIGLSARAIATYAHAWGGLAPLAFTDESHADSLSLGASASLDLRF
jgi:hypothetical protein